MLKNIFTHVLAAEEAEAMFTYLPSSWLDLKLLQLSKGSVNSSCCSSWWPLCQSALLKMILRLTMGVQRGCMEIALTPF